MPWSIKVDDDARETALDAARRSGMTLSEWLQKAIAEHAAEESIPPAPETPEEDGDDDVEAVTEAVKRLVRRLKAMDADARLAISGLKERLDEIEATLGRAGGTGPGGGKGAESLKGVAAMVNRLARDIDDADETARSTVEGLPGTAKAEPMKASVTDAIQSLDERMAAISARRSASLPPPRRPGTIDELRDRLDSLLARGAGEPQPRQSAARLELHAQGAGSPYRAGKVAARQGSRCRRAGRGRRARPPHRGAAGRYRKPPDEGRNRRARAPTRNRRTSSPRRSPRLRRARFRPTRATISSGTSPTGPSPTPSMLSVRTLLASTSVSRR